MIEKSAERRIDALEPRRRLGATLTRTMNMPPPANDNALPLIVRLSLAVGAAAVLAGAATLVHLFG
jgi:hypothetical protein